MVAAILGDTEGVFPASVGGGNTGIAASASLPVGLGRVDGRMS
jgi:hypothetical protein